MFRIQIHMHHVPMYESTYIEGDKPVRSRLYKGFFDYRTHAVLLDWLTRQVGPLTNIELQLPLIGEGWLIDEGYGDEGALGQSFEEDGLYRLSNSYRRPYGFWLQIDDDDNALLFKLSGLWQQLFRKGHRWGSIEPNLV